MAVANGWASERAVLAAGGGSQPLPHAGTVSWVVAVRAPPGAEGSCTGVLLHPPVGNGAGNCQVCPAWLFPLALAVSPTAGLCLVLSVQHG